MKKLWCLLLCAACLLSFGAAGCQPACAKALPVITAAQVYTNDLEQWVVDVRAQVAKMPLPPETIAQVNADLDKASAIARSAYDAESAAISACSALDIGALFAGIVPLVDDVVQLVALFASTSKGSVSPPMRQPLIAVRMRGVGHG